MTTPDNHVSPLTMVTVSVVMSASPAAMQPAVMIATPGDCAPLFGLSRRGCGKQNTKGRDGSERQNNLAHYQSPMDAHDGV
jgi:hypothetical protein